MFVFSHFVEISCLSQLPDDFVGYSKRIRETSFTSHIDILCIYMEYLVCDKDTRTRHW